MSGWRAVWTIIRFGWKRDRMGILFTFLFAMYVATTVGFSLQQLLKEKEIDTMYVMVDWMYLMMYPVFGQLMNRTSFAIWRDDVYTKKIALWRTMPIPPEVIIRARQLSMAMQIPLISIAFMTLQYGIAPALRDHVSPLHWLAVAMVWMCYSIVINAIFIWLELGVSGKGYVVGILIFMLACVIVSVSLRLAGIDLFSELIRQIQAGHYGWLPVGIAAAAAAVEAGYRATLKKMRSRSYVF